MTGAESSGATRRPLVSLADDEKIVITVLRDAVARGDGSLTVDQAQRLTAWRFAARVEHILKDQAERREDELDAALNRRWLVHDTNCIVVASSKGGVGKTTNTVQLGTCPATYLPNQRVCAVDFNVGGGGLQAAVADDRAAQHTLFELHRDRNQITRHSVLQSYVSSLPSGLDLLTVPPQPELALEITSEHYEQLFDELLLETYDVLVLDCSPDITNPVTTWALQRGTQLIIATEQGYLAGGYIPTDGLYIQFWYLDGSAGWQPFSHLALATPPTGRWATSVPIPAASAGYLYEIKATVVSSPELPSAAPATAMRTPGSSTSRPSAPPARRPPAISATAPPSPSTAS